MKTAVPSAAFAILVAAVPASSQEPQGVSPDSARTTVTFRAVVDNAADRRCDTGDTMPVARPSVEVRMPVVQDPGDAAPIPNACSTASSAAREARPAAPPGWLRPRR